MADAAQGLFDRLYSAGKEAFDAAKKPFIKKALKRKLQSAYDDAGKKSIEAQIQLNKSHEDFTNYDVNKVLEQLQIITQCDEIQAQIKKEWSDLFATEMRTEDED